MRTLHGTTIRDFHLASYTSTSTSQRCEEDPKARTKRPGAVTPSATSSCVTLVPGDSSQARRKRTVVKRRWTRQCRCLDLTAAEVSAARHPHVSQHFRKKLSTKNKGPAKKNKRAKVCGLYTAIHSRKFRRTVVTFATQGSKGGKRRGLQILQMSFSSLQSRVAFGAIGGCAEAKSAEKSGGSG